MGAAGLAIAGGVMMGTGNAAQAYGARQANDAQMRIARQEMEESAALDRENAAKLAALLQQEGVDQRIEEASTLEAGERDALTDVAATVAESRGRVGSVGSEAAEGEITRSLEGVKAAGSRSGALLAKIRAQRQQQEESQTRGRQYAVDRNRLAYKSRGRQRLYPLLMQAAGMKGAETRQAGSATSALGALLLQYGIGGGSTGGAPKTMAV